ncbi:MAG: biopolymer transporter Tol [Opitutaceae bacterium]|jgi:hypothetical protein|nr:biopolymer transporter Tol [Opitutaceae bacterium]
MIKPVPFLSLLVICMAATRVLDAQPWLLDSPVLTTPELRAWRDARILPVAPSRNAHSMHSYFNTCPESLDGRHVLYFSSTAANGETGDLRILERATGVERTLVANLTAEDAHRTACQQWVAGGRMVAYHDFRDGRWIVAVTDIETGHERILATDRQLGFGATAGEWIPVYGCHWKPGEHRDLELINVTTGTIKPAVLAGDVLARYGREVVRMVGEGDISLFFPVMSPDGKKVMFKVSRGAGTDNFRARKASKREGKFVYDLAAQRFIGFYERWGHPAWTPDSAGILEKGIRIYDLNTSSVRRHAVGSPSNHQSVSPDGRLYVADSDIARRETGKTGEWGIIVGSLETGEFTTIHRFMNRDGARSWRKPDPHPVFSADGKRVYFNINDGGFTRLHVATIAAVPSP